MNFQIECGLCGAVVPGQTRHEASEDAFNLGWRVMGAGPVLCGDCLDEQDTL